MFLSVLSIKNFRCFDGQNHIIEFNSGLTVLVGENDSGKSAIMDAIRIVLGTTDLGWTRIDASDFNNEDISSTINITCKFDDLTPSEQGAFLECLTYEDDKGISKPFLYLHWECKYLSSFRPPRPVSKYSTGKDGNGPAPAAEARELLRITYLKALRDASNDMQAGKNSRLSQIVQNLPDVSKGVDKYQKGDDIESLSLVGIADLSNTLLLNHTGLAAINKNMTEILNKEMLLKKDHIQTKFEVAGSASKETQKMIGLLEKLDVAIDKESCAMQGRIGLGTSNIISMACEMLLNKESQAAGRSSFLLIEEPEAHIHAQRQLKLIQSIEDEVSNKPQQVIITTHSPLLASVVKLANIVIVKEGKVFPLAKGQTKLNDDDYKYLEKYLDATKANLFFARSVIIVEGPGEALLFPTLAKLLGRSFTDYGTSLVDVRSTGLRRYSTIFQRKTEEQVLDVNVACVADRDVMPNCAPGICLNDSYTDRSIWPKENDRNWNVEADFTPEALEDRISVIKGKADGQQVKTFVSDHWTLEYDLAYKGLMDSEMMVVLINALVEVTYKKENWTEYTNDIRASIDAYHSPEEKAAYFYHFFTKKGTSKAEFAQRLAVELEDQYADKAPELKAVLPKYIVDAITYVTEE